ncbi:ABC transporter ATP-binding protein [Saccharospirillum salsuginis]|uniref:ABC transporter permease n=1 Tax=Saccharospirillum salsuginis TaxID=418750 RepID=A0A918N6S8_9GAMM|nr:ABC transporter ATP-binding protein [Saccharospirillum salsuginis]GGX47706.1 ABC transporter permease [Saccharospirillum salsuginis]
MSKTLERTQPDSLSQRGTRSLLTQIWRDYVAQHTGLLLIALVLMIIEGSALGAVSYLVRPLFDQVMVAGNQDMIGLVAIGLFVTFLARALGGFGQRVITVSVGLRVVTGLQKDLLAHLIKLDTGFFFRNSPGALIERVRGDAQTLQGLASNALMTLGRDTFSLIALLGVAIYNDWLWTLIAFVGIPSLVLPVIYLQKRIRNTTRRARMTSANISTRLDEIFHGINAIKLNNLDMHEKHRFTKEVDRFLHAQTHSEMGKAGMPAMIDIIAGLGFMAVVYFGGQQIIAGEKSLGEFMSFFVAMGLIFDPLRRLSNVGGVIQAAMASIERLYGLFEVQPTIVNQPRLADNIEAAARQDVVLDNVHFAYGDNPVLNGLTFTAPARKITALVGPSGAGKTTVFNLLTRLIEPQSGRILLGDTPIDAFDLRDLRHQFAVVSQESALFDESIRQNIALGELSADESAVEAAADQALVTRFTDATAEGLDALAGPRGTNLSGGQRQRVVIARAILRDAPVLLLDEATSALDTRTEQEIQATLDRISRDKTTLVIAHRLSTVMNADVIHVLDKGKVVESGTHEELLAKKGAYFGLYQTLEQ